MSSISVCHLTSVHKDGDVRIFHKECVSLAEVGYKVSLIIPNTSSRIEKDVNIISFEAPKGNRLTRMIKTVNIVFQKAIEVDADIYHFHDPELLRIAKKLKRKGKVVIYDTHEDLPRQLLSKKYIKPIIRKSLSLFMERYENNISAKLDAIITATPFIRDRFLQVNPKTIDINNFPLDKEINTKDTLPNKFESKNICYIGGLTEIRGIKEVVGAMNFCPETTLKLAGEFFPIGFKDSVKQIKGWNQIDELGFISRDEAISLKSNSIAGIVTFLPEENHINAQPNKIFEYMASGLPVIGSNFPLWKTIIEDNNAGICVDPLNPQEIADAINYLISNPNIAKEMGENGKKLVIEKYNWEMEKKKLIELYKSLES
jgi:glycosyltransferase involved in cell wall biosynthesis